MDDDEALSPRQPAPSIERAMEPDGPVNNRLSHLNLRADPDAQATVSDFLDFTEYLPADITRSLTLIGNLGETYVDSSSNVHQLTTLWGRLPTLPSTDKTRPVALRAEIADDLHHALHSRVFSLAEARRMTENVLRHYARAKTILEKLTTMQENYPTAEEQKSPVTAAKSPQLSRAPKVAQRGEAQKVRRPRVPRITVPGEVLAPYDLNFDAYTTGSGSSSDEEDDDDEGLTPAPQPRLKAAKGTSKVPKPGRGPRAAHGTSHAPGTPFLSTSAAMAQLAPPPANAVIGSSDAPWGQLTPYELARLRKRMKKNAAWTPSDTMVARELNNLGRGVDAFRAAKKKAEEEGRAFDGKMPEPDVDPDTGQTRMPAGALTLEALASDDKNLSNRGMKLNEAKKLKRELLAKMAAEEAEESARRFDAIARTLMLDPSQAGAQDQAKAKAKAQKKRKRDSATEVDSEKMETPESQPQRPQLKRTKTETPVPPPILTPGGSQLAAHETPSQPTAQRTSTAGLLHSTTPIPLPIHGQDQSITAKSVTSATSPDSSYAGPSGASASASASAPAPVKLPPAETPIPPPVISPRKSITPILPPTRETRKTQATRAQEEARATQATAVSSRSTSPTTAITPADADAAAADASTSGPTTAPTTATTAAGAATATTAAPPPPTTRRPGSRGKAASQEPQPSLAADRPRRTSTARNTPAPPESTTAAAANTLTTPSNATTGPSPNHQPPSSSSAISSMVTSALTAMAASAATAGSPTGPATTQGAAAVTQGAAAGAGALAAAGRPQGGRRAKRPAPGVISRTNSGGNSAVGARKAAPRRKSRSKGSAAAASASAAAARAANAAGAGAGGDGNGGSGSGGSGGDGQDVVEVDDEGNVIDPQEERYCLCNRVSFGTMIQCDNVDCKLEWFHLECVGLSDIPARTTKWYCPDCRKALNIGEKGEVSARGVRA
ncbi:hypothetical protein B0J18DRAFT_198131 [Chaetomium sp. MPI-SDFR-AT-0129]|nr:hypothetical protein B0J18DRAFT_198131 [Chaetomium sp. MPI-SDFR-AT-0129]